MKQGEMLGGILFAAIILFAVMGLVGPGSKIGTAWQYLSGGPSGNSNVQQSSSSNIQPPASGTSIVGSPSTTVVSVIH
jgi:hypothetical protein